MNIFIIGYMASGKTTFGSALANKLEIPFIDLDQYIEEKMGMTIAQIFEQKGESEFRALEKEMLHSLENETQHAVIACGGGTPCHFDNMDFINNNGISVFLETSTPVLISRLQGENSKRPLVAGKSDEEIAQKVLSQLCERLPYYLQAKLKWSGDDLENAEQIEKNVSSFISSYPSIFR